MTIIVCRAMRRPATRPVPARPGEHAATMDIAEASRWEPRTDHMHRNKSGIIDASLRYAECPNQIKGVAAKLSLLRLGL